MRYLVHITNYSPSTTAETLFQYDIPCSPHLAARASGRNIPTDSNLLQAIYKIASRCARSGPGWLFIETAGGVHSPGPSGQPQAELYAPLRVPAILVGDSKLGGISSTISAFESLKIRGYDVEAILMLEGQYENHRYLEEYFAPRDDPLIQTIPSPPSRHEHYQAELEQMQSYYDQVSNSNGMTTVLDTLDQRSRKRIARLEQMPHDASKTIWYPFTQQKLLTPGRITVIDSAHGDFFQTLDNMVEKPKSPDEPVLQPAFDGSASWWTQGLGHANSQLTLAAAYAAGRYGHVMFAEGIHEPALALAQSLLDGMSNSRLSRVFYSDNGSTGCEVAVKMALRAARKRYGWSASEKLSIIGLKGGYHGDTIGAMDCSEPGPFNEKVEWYEDKGFWFDYPTVRCYEGRWHIDMPDELQVHTGGGSSYDTLHDALDINGRGNEKAFHRYKKYIRGTLEALTAKGFRFGALMLEPVILGAGGMVFVDPLFQKALVEVVRESQDVFGNASESDEKGPQDWAGLPVIFDEVFTGLYRLGRFSSASFLDSFADISVHAKLLTGGLVPLCTTLASESIFSAFESDNKTDALLHGHSYTAHPVGCQVAVESLRELGDLNRNGHWDWAKAEGWQADAAVAYTTHSGCSNHQDAPWSVWSKDFVDTVSCQTGVVSGVWALGSVLAITLRAEGGQGYTGKGAARLQSRLREGTESWNVHSRVLGNVFYIMAGQTTSKATIQSLQGLCLKALKDLAQ